MKCDYTHLNHNSLVSQKNKSDHQGRYYKGSLLYMQKQICKISQKKYHSLFPSHLEIIKPIFNSSMISNDGYLGLGWWFILNALCWKCDL